MIASTKTLTETHRRCCYLYNRELISYSLAWDWQKKLLQERIDNPSLHDALILLEHPPVYTLGQGASLDFVKFDIDKSGFEVYRVERGGEVTYHCPGQLVGYPIINLRYYRQDLHWYLRQLEEVLIKVLAVYGLKGDRLNRLTGVWVEGVKVGAIGIKVSRWVTMHGFALNVCPDLTGFEQIVPCGIADKAVGSMAQWIPGIKLEEVRTQLAVAFAEVFRVDFIENQEL
ncbi:lipoyl(octanoyl) transferase LipB [Chlorogloea sp. CCALA 695]|uniref:lipoyl(octanoyl) transferase LipB n=1 Tax=Chlorogloea sp. CCALA 695 TaxID=2107693 RepID=UPI000D08508A|nr:lipoyl(octanoyl) transferase LipB [Chlorogloea sp. CCALA 695]PSB33507.1 lipoyl(octanoyl) transferase [Chlorogloea sp. CCALA 695]